MLTFIRRRREKYRTHAKNYSKTPNILALLFGSSSKVGKKKARKNAHIARGVRTAKALYSAVLFQKRLGTPSYRETKVFNVLFIRDIGDRKPQGLSKYEKE